MKRVFHLVVCGLCCAMALTAPCLAKEASAQIQTLTASTTAESTVIGSGARAMGMGGAFVAVADDATAASWNPAGLSLLARPEVSFVHETIKLSVVVPTQATSRSTDGKMTQSGYGTGYSLASTVAAPEFLSITYPLAAGQWKVVPQFSYRRAIRRDFDNSSTRGPNVNQNFLANGLTTTTSITNLVEADAGGGLDVYAFAAGVSSDPRWRVGVALNVWRENSTLKTVTTPVAASENLITSTSVNNSNSDFSGTSADVGVLLRPVRYLSIGAVFRSGFKMATSGLSDTVFSYDTEPFGGVVLHQILQSSSTIAWPKGFAVGVALSLHDALLVSVDYTFSGWASTTRDLSTTVTTTFSPPRVPPTTTTTSTSSGTYPYGGTSFLGLTQSDSHQIRMGGEFLAFRASSGAFIGIPFRAGIYRDRQLQPQLDGSPLGSTGVTAGVGVLWQQLSVDMAVVHQTVAGDLIPSTHTNTTSATNTSVTTLTDSGRLESAFTRLLLSTTFRF